MLKRAADRCAIRFVCNGGGCAVPAMGVILRLQELGKELRDLYDKAADGEKVTMIHLFSIRNAKELTSFSAKEVVIEAGMAESLKSEISKGIKLAKYVQPK